MSEMYRGFEISPDRDLPGRWSWVHPDYDGPPDKRCGSASSLFEARSEIDDLLED